MSMTLTFDLELKYGHISPPPPAEYVGMSKSSRNFKFAFAQNLDLHCMMWMHMIKTNTVCSMFQNWDIKLLVRALEWYSKDPGLSPGGDACFSH